MSEFKEFSEAARLYAANVHVVEAMREQFETDISQYVDTLLQRIQGLMPDVELQDQVTKGYRYWWIKIDGQDRDSSIVAHCSTTKPELLNDQKLLLHIYTRSPSEKKQAKLKFVPQDPQFSDFCKPGNSPFSFVVATISVLETDLLEGPAAAIAGLMKVLHEIDKETSAS